MINTESLDWSDATIPDLITALKMGMHFADYIKQTDPVLWARACQYSTDCVPAEELKRFEEGSTM
jgi:hypothetical protein